MRGPAPCPACGAGSPGPVRLNIHPPRVFGPEGPGREDASPRPEDFCPRCGRKVVLRIAPPMLARGGAG